MAVTSLAPPTAGVVERSYPRWLMLAISGATVLFVLAQLGVGLTLRTLTYPVVAFPMFADAPKVEIEPVITAVTADGAAHVIAPSDLGLVHDQVNFYITREIAKNNGTVHMGAPDKLKFMGSLWAAKHGNPVVTSVSMVFDEHALDGSGKVTAVPIVSWKSPGTSS
jgi:hypothetical protein